MSTVRVATYAGPGTNPKIQNVPRPAVSAHAALIQVDACGVCGTDLHILKGHWPKPLPWPLTLGHEVAGTIIEKGAALSTDYTGQSLALGDRVALPPLMPCGSCHYCLHYPQHANKCRNPTYYGRYLPFKKPPHLWGGWAEMVYIDLEMLPATKIYRLPGDMSPIIGSLAEPLSCCIRALGRAVDVNGFRLGDTVVIQGSGPIGLLMVATAREMGAGQIVVIGAPEDPRLALCRRFGADVTVCLHDHPEPADRIKVVRSLVTEYGADLVIDCCGHPDAGPEGVEMLRDGGTYVEMGQFTDAGSIKTNWHRLCTKDLTLLGSWGITAEDMPKGIALLNRTRDRYPWAAMQTLFPFDQAGLEAATAAARAMRCVKATIVPTETAAQ